MTIVKAVAFQYDPDEAVRRLLESFRMMVNHALWVGTRQGIRSHFRLISAVYEDFKRYGLHSHYTLSACEVASGILRNHRRGHRAPVARQLFLKLDNQTYRLQGDTLRIPIRPRRFLTLRLRVGGYQRKFLKDSSLKLGSVTITESKAIVAFERGSFQQTEYRSLVAYDTNELSLDGAFSDGKQIKPIQIPLKNIARIRAFHFKRRRQLQSRLSPCRRKLNAKLAEDRGRERRSVDAILHGIAKTQVRFAKEKNAKIVLENLKGIRGNVNKRVKKRNPHNGKVQQVSIHSKPLKRRLNSWPFSRLHSFIEYKAKWEGVPVAHVPAKNTSRTCPRCGCLRTGHNGEQDPKARQAFRCPECGWRCDRHLNAALNLLRTQDEGRWFSPDRYPHEVMTALRAYGIEAKPSSTEDLTEPCAGNVVMTDETDRDSDSDPSGRASERERMGRVESLEQ